MDFKESPRKMEQRTQLNKKLKSNLLWTSFYCFLGLALSSYALYIEYIHDQDPSYKAMCDISSSVSCSVVFTTRYAKGFGLMPADSMFNLPNPIYGIGFYLLLGLLNLITRKNKLMAKIFLTLTILSNFGSIYLGALLIFVIKNLCVVCTAIYVVNFLLLLSAIKKKNILKKFDEKTD